MMQMLWQMNDTLLPSVHIPSFNHILPSIPGKLLPAQGFASLVSAML